MGVWVKVVLFSPHRGRSHRVRHRHRSLGHRGRSRLTYPSRLRPLRRSNRLRLPIIPNLTSGRTGGTDPILRVDDTPQIVDGDRTERSEGGVWVVRAVRATWAVD